MTTLHRLLDAAQRYPNAYGDGLATHLPMALHALAGLGADDARLAAWFGTYVGRFGAARAAPEAAALDMAADWRDLRGRADAYPTWRATFATALARDGVDATLRRVLPALMPGAAAAAFHGLIRTAHAVESGHRGELASALAQWASRWQPTPAEPGPPLAFDDWTARLASRRGEFEAAGRLIQTRMVAAAGSPAFRDLAGRLEPQADTLDRLNDVAVAEYARGGDFTVLHMCTAGRAARVLMPWIDDAAAAGRELVSAWTAAFLSTRPIAAPAAPAPLPWPELRRRAIAQDDEHVIKLVHACGELGAAAGSPPHLAAATRAVLA